MNNIIKIDKKITGWKVKEKESVAQILEVNAPKRPAELSCEIHHVQIKGEEWIVMVGMLNDRPYEVMGGLASYVSIPKKYKLGTTVKTPRKTTNSRYDLRFGDADEEIIIKDIVTIFENPNYGVLTRMISMALRHGAPVQYLVEQLQKDKDSDMFSFSKVISRVLKKYISDGKTSSVSCDNCNSKELIYQGGCPVCKDCGYSKCG